MTTSIQHPQTDPQRPSLVTVHNAGARTERSFPTRAQAQAYADAVNMADSAKSDLKEVQGTLPFCSGPDASCGVSDLKSPPPSCPPSTTLLEAIATYRARKAKARVKKRTLRAERSIISRLLIDFGPRSLDSITSDDIANFIEKLTHRNGGLRSASPQARSNALMLIKRIFRDSGVRDPFPYIVRVALHRKRNLRVFPVAQIATMLSSALPHQRGMLALAIFGGIRPRELERMSAGAVDLKRRAIHISSKLCRDGRSTLLTSTGHLNEGTAPGLPSVLWDWLAEFPFVPQRWGRVKARLGASIGYWIPNGCRQTALANYAAIHGRTAALAFGGYESGDLPMQASIVGLVSVEDAKRFYALTPAFVFASKPRSSP